jgi:hypothetical protein
LNDSIAWLLEELTMGGDETLPSNLETITIIIDVSSSIREIDVTQAKALSGILSNERHFPKVKEVRLGFRVGLWSRISYAGYVEEEKKHKETLESAMGTLKERGVLRLCW